MWYNKIIIVLCFLEIFLSFSNSQTYARTNTGNLRQSVLASPRADLTVALLIRYRNAVVPIEDAMSRSELVRIAVQAVGGVRQIKEKIVAREPDISPAMMTVATYADILCQYCMQQQIQWCISQYCYAG